MEPLIEFGPVPRERSFRAAKFDALCLAGACMSARGALEMPHSASVSQLHTP